MKLNEEDIIRLVEQDDWMMNVLETVQMLKLSDWWICAGFLRSKIWDTLHDFAERTPLTDVDVIYFDSSTVSEKAEKILEENLSIRMPHVPWSVKKQARMHVINGFSPYISAEDGIAHFPETVTAIGVKLNVNKQVVLTAPYGIEDVVQMVVNPTPYFKCELYEKYQERVKKKNWSQTWNKVKNNI